MFASTPGPNVDGATAKTGMNLAIPEVILVIQLTSGPTNTLATKFAVERNIEKLIKENVHPLYLGSPS